MFMSHESLVAKLVQEVYGWECRRYLSGLFSNICKDEDLIIALLSSTTVEQQEERHKTLAVLTLTAESKMSILEVISVDKSYTTLSYEPWASTFMEAQSSHS